MSAENKQILIFVRPPLDLSSRILNLHRAVSAQFQNLYMAHADFDWESHLMVYLSPMPNNNLPGVLQTTGDVVAKANKFEVELGEIKQIAGGFVALDIASTGLFQLRERLVPALKPFRGSEIKPHYQERWGSFTDLEKERILSTGLPYEYNPHLTIAGFGSSSEEIPTALEFARAHESFVGEKFTAEVVRVAQQSDDPSIDWPIVGEYPLL